MRRCAMTGKTPAVNTAYKGNGLKYLLTKYVKKPDTLPVQITGNVLLKHADLLRSAKGLQDNMNFSKPMIKDILRPKGAEWGMEKASTADFVETFATRFKKSCRMYQQGLLTGRSWAVAIKEGKEKRYGEQQKKKKQSKKTKIVDNKRKQAEAEEEATAPNSASDDGDDEEDEEEAGEDEEGEQELAKDEDLAEDAPAEKATTKSTVQASTPAAKKFKMITPQAAVYFDSEQQCAIRATGNATHLVALKDLFIDKAIDSRFALAQWPEGRITPVTNLRIDELEARVVDSLLVDETQATQKPATGNKTQTTEKKIVANKFAWCAIRKTDGAKVRIGHRKNAGKDVFILFHKEEQLTQVTGSLFPTASDPVEACFAWFKEKCAKYAEEEITLEELEAFKDLLKEEARATRPKTEKPAKTKEVKKTIEKKPATTREKASCSSSSTAPKPVMRPPPSMGFLETFTDPQTGEWEASQ